MRGRAGGFARLVGAQLSHPSGFAGRLVLGYATPEAMAAMPFTAAGFETPASRIHGRSAGAFVVTETVTPRSASDGMPLVPSTSPPSDSR